MGLDAGALADRRARAVGGDQQAGDMDRAASWNEGLTVSRCGPAPTGNL